MALITLKEYAERHGRDPVVVRQKAIRGGFKTAHHLGRDWVIDEDEPYVDDRVRNGKYRDWRNKYPKRSDAAVEPENVSAAPEEEQPNESE